MKTFKGRYLVHKGDVYLPDIDIFKNIENNIDETNHVIMITDGDVIFNPNNKSNIIDYIDYDFEMDEVVDVVCCIDNINEYLSGISEEQIIMID